MTWLPEIRASLLLALQTCRSAEAERHIRRALKLMDADKPQAREGRWTCPYDGQPCGDACALTAGLHGRCGRAGA